MENESETPKASALKGRKRSPEFKVKLAAAIARRKAAGLGWGRKAKVVVPVASVPVAPVAVPA